MLNKICQMQFYCIKMSQYFPKPYEPFGGDVNVKVDLSNYAIKFNLKMQQELIHLNKQQNLIYSV